MAAYTTTDFLNSVRQRGGIPTSTNTNNVNNTTNLLALATEELHIKLLPLIMSVREEFYVATTDYTIVAGTAAYAIPSRASGMVLRDIQLVSGTMVWQLEPIGPEDVSTTMQGTPTSYYLQHNNIVLYPTPSSAYGTLRVTYYSRPNRLAPTSACAQITAINTSTFTVTVAAVPSTMATAVTVDLIGAAVPYVTRAADSAIVSATATTITFASLPSDLAVGDWVALAEYSPIPQIPHEFQPVLAQMTAVKALESIGDLNGSANARKDLETLTKYALQMITPRNHGVGRKIINRNWRR